MSVGIKIWLNDGLDLEVMQLYISVVKSRRQHNMVIVMVCSESNENFKTWKQRVHSA